MNEILCIVRIHFRRFGLIRLGDRILPGVSTKDIGYLTHCALTGLWGSRSPRPFLILDQEERESVVPVLGYFQVPKTYLSNQQVIQLQEELLDLAKINAAIDVYNMVDWSSFQAKPLPNQWTPGRVYRFRVRCVPVQRIHGREMDIFPKFGRPQDRNRVYSSWIERQFSKYGVSVLDCSMERFQLSTQFRRTQGEHRKGVVFQSPDAIMSGVLRIEDPVGFSRLLCEGIGHHRGFGYGLVLISV